jgi:hypothetical protein
MILALFDQTGQPTREAVGKALKREGQKRALESAGGWSGEILGAFRLWCATRRGLLVTIEDFRAQCPSSLHPQSHKAWGALPRLAVAAQLIEPTNEYVMARTPRTHAHPVRRWRIL